MNATRTRRERERKRTTRTMKMLFSLISVVKKYHVEAVVVVVGPKKAILRRKNKINFLEKEGALKLVKAYFMTSTLNLRISIFRAVVVAQLVEQFLPTIEIGLSWRENILLGCFGRKKWRL